MSQPSPAPVQVVVMGVSGTGKSSVAASLAEQLGWHFVEGDDLHPRRNVEKMESGEPLTDEDRRPWLDRVNAAMREQDDAGASTLVTCSALKRSYRRRLGEDLVGSVFFLHLAAPFDVLEPRMAQRTRHFMPPGLLRSQFETLEDLAPDEPGAVVDVSPPLEEVVAMSLRVVRERVAAG